VNQRLISTFRSGLKTAKEKRGRFSLFLFAFSVHAKLFYGCNLYVRLEEVAILR